jgi:hypothetical protein
VLKLELGAPITVREGGFPALAEAFVAGIEQKFP